MPTRTIDTQTFEGETIQCAKFVSDEPFSWKAAQIVSAECDYEFQMVAKSSVATTLTIQVGDTVKTQAITTEFTRFVIPFPSVTNDVDSLYITFPAGTYWLYNLQLERASTPSAWRPAPEDAEDYADKAAQQAVDDQTQLDVFNKLTNNGASQGIYLLDGQLYINGEYIAANTISGNKIHGGTISGTEIDIGDGVFTVDENGKVTSQNMEITGGSFKVNGTSTTWQGITLNYSNFKCYVSPMTFQAQRTENDVEIVSNMDYLNFRHLRGGNEMMSLSDATNGMNFRLLNASGQLQAKYSSAGGQGGSSELYYNGTIGISEHASPSSSYIYLYDAGTMRAGLYVSSSSARLQLGKNSLTRTVIEENNFYMYNASNKMRVFLSPTGLRFYDDNGNLTKSYPAT